jgi:hypothetical protein
MGCRALTGRLRGAIVRLNPKIPVEASRSVSELLALVAQRGAVGVAPLSVRRAQGR